MNEKIIKCLKKWWEEYKNDIFGLQIKEIYNFLMKESSIYEDSLDGSQKILMPTIQVSKS